LLKRSLEGHCQLPVVSLGREQQIFKFAEFEAKALFGSLVCFVTPSEMFLN